MPVKRETWRPTRRDVIIAGASVALCSAERSVAVPRETHQEYLIVFSFVVRKNGMAHDECVRHWLEVHGPIARHVPGVKGFVASELIEPEQVTRGDGFDGIAVIWYAADEPVQKTLSSSAGKAWLADGDTFIRRDRAGGVAGPQHLLLSPRVRDGAIKRMDFLVPTTGMTIEQFQAECLAVQRQIVKRGSGLQGLAMTAPRSIRRTRFAFGAVIESWWADDGGAADAPSGWHSARALLDSIADPEKSVSVTVRDHVFVTPPA